MSPRAGLRWLTARMELILYLLPLGFIFDFVGYVPPYLSLLAIYLLLGLRLALTPSRRAARGGAGLLLAAALIALLDVPSAARICLLLAAHHWVWLSVTDVPRRLAAGVAGFTVVHLALFESTVGHPALEALARWGCGLAGWGSGSSYALGFTYLNVGALLLFLWLSVFNWDRGFMTKARTACYLIVGLLASALLCAVLLRKIEFGAEFAWKLQYREIFGYAELWQHLKGLLLILFPGLVFLAQLLVFVVLHEDAGAPDEGPPAGRRRRMPWPLIIPLAVAALALCMPPTTWRKPVTSRLIFVERGVVSFSKPDYTRFGRAAGGMYGLLPEYTRLFGCESTIVQDVPADLGPGDILVFTNLDEPLEPAVLERIWDFVREGGKLWVLGDHTFIKNGRNHINDLLEPTAISLAHDSAQFFPQGWFNSYRFLQGTPFGRLRDDAENAPAILVGASLEVRPPAEPFIRGRFAYGDLGVTTPDDKRGYIGDFEYQPRERLGDLVLVAGQTVGRGKVLVFGDTTSFFNNNLPRSVTLLRAVLSWFGSPPGPMQLRSRLMHLGLACLLAMLAVLLFLWRSRPWSLPLLLTLAVASGVAHHAPGLLRFDPVFSRQQMAVIDFSHQPYASRHSSMGDGLHGLTINLMRHGMLPVIMNRWNPEFLSAAGLLSLNAPRRSFSRAARDDVFAFAGGGGTVLLTCGYLEAEHCRTLLDGVRLDVRGLPLGRFFDRPAFGGPVSFLSAWPIVTDRADARVLCAYDDWPLMVEVEIGRGRLILIGDSEFLHNRNLEGLENHDPANISFVRSLLDYVRGGPHS